MNKIIFLIAIVFSSCSSSLNDGDSPYDHFFGVGVFDEEMRNEITFKNNTNRDAIVCMLDTITQKTIRNEYIRKYSIYKMENVPNGFYFMKVFYGIDWDSHAWLNDGKIRGGFTTNINYTISDESKDVIFMEQAETSDGVQYSTWEVSLKSEIKGNMEQREISANSFFN